ncbi:hypothetical protein ACH5RR_036606 [Cinchona calisaya]|uniref:KIB1-4 beta-propeller domain-containing protein n=1 Tax=Cinchona calisaya TaxID=153742 RepID=A0ABD2Y8G1_9GENT
MVSRQKDFSVVVDWSNLPRALWDYVRLGDVCKSWLSVAADQEHHRIARIQKEPPMLFICEPELELSNYPFEFPHRSRILGSSYGWMAIEHTFACDYLVHKVIWSCDPNNNHLDYFVVAAIYGFPEGVAFIRPGEDSWTFYHDTDGYGPEGDLLLVRKLPFLLSAEFKLSVEFKVYKLMYNTNIPPSLDWVEIQGLENGDTIFLDETHSLCISVSGLPNCNPNSIYFTQKTDLDSLSVS